MEPMFKKSVVSPKSLLKYHNVFATLDRGCSLTKLLYIKSVPSDETKVSLEMAAFSNKNFAEALAWLVARAKEEGQFNAGKIIRATGVGGERYKEEIESKLKMEVEFVHEFIAQQHGAHFLVNNFEDDEFCYPDESANFRSPPEDMPEWIRNVQKKYEEHYSMYDGKRFPAIFGFCGSGIGFNKLNEDHSTEILGVTMQGGKSFMGMAKLIVGTNDYNELMRLAGRGSRGNVDTQVGEMFAQGETSEYRKLPPEMPLFPFGKAADMEECSFDKSDLAASVIGGFQAGLVPQIAAYAKMHRIRRVYLGGHLFSGEPMRSTFNMTKTMTPGMGPVIVRFLSNGHTGCIGCLLVSQEESTVMKSKMSVG